MPGGPSFADQEIADLLKSMADKLESGELSHNDVIEGMFAIASLERTVIVRDGPLRSQGVLSFGSENEGLEGIGFFVDARALPEYDPTPQLPEVETER